MNRPSSHDNRRRDIHIAADAAALLRRYYLADIGPRLHPMLTSPKPHARLYAGWCLALIEAEACVPELIPLLKDPHPHVRYDIAVALGNIKDPRAIDPLIELLLTPDDKECAAAGALRDYGEEMIPRIEALLAQPDLANRTIVGWLLKNLKGKDDD